jgi:hypothetical protein
MIEVKEYLESGILELYVFGTLSSYEMNEVSKMAAQHPEIQEEILSIEKAVITLSYSMAPHVSLHNFERIKRRLKLKHQGVVGMKPKSNTVSYIGWAAAIVLMLGLGYQFTKTAAIKENVIAAEIQKSKLKKERDSIQLQKQQMETVLAVIRDENNTVVPLSGQEVAPEAKAKVYWNKQTEVVYIDASNLPEPPEGMVYQIWSLKLNPLTPTSIGLLADFKTNDAKVFQVEKTTGAEAFGITLEPAGGSASPTMEQLYTLGVVKT